MRDHQDAADRGCNDCGAFTLVELTVATAILSVIMLLIFNITQQTGDAWKNSAEKIEAFQNARAAFETMTRLVSQATLHTYYDYFSANGQRRTNANASNFVPAKYGRYSDLHFVSGKNLLDGTAGPRQITHSIFFQTSAGYTDSSDYRNLENTLNAVGFYVEFGPDPQLPVFLGSQPDQNGYRLIQFTQSCTELAVYESNDDMNWFRDPLEFDKSKVTHSLAENIVALIVHPKISDRDRTSTGTYLAPDFEYDSRVSWTSGSQPNTQHQLPPLVDVTLIAVEKGSFARAFGNPSAAPDLGQLTPSPLFQRAEDLDKPSGSDLEEFESILNAEPGNRAGNTHRLKYRIFRSEIPIRAAKWSR